MDLQSKYKNAIQLEMVTDMRSIPTVKTEHWTSAPFTEHPLRAHFDRRKRSVLSVASESCVYPLVLLVGTLRIDATVVVALYERFPGGKLACLSLTCCELLATRLDSTECDPWRGRQVGLLFLRNDAVVLCSVAYRSMSSSPVHDLL